MLAKLDWIPPPPFHAPNGTSASDVENSLMMITIAAGYLMVLVGIGASLIS